MTTIFFIICYFSEVTVKELSVEIQT